MVGHPLELEVARGDPLAGRSGEPACEDVGEWPVSGRRLLEERPGVVPGGADLSAHGLRERAHERGDELLSEPWHLPVEARLADVVEEGQGDVDGDPVEVRGRVEGVGEGEHDGPLAPRVGVRRRADVPGVRVDQLRARERESVGVAGPLLLPPAIEVPGRSDGVGDALVVEGEPVFLAEEDVTSADPALERLHLLDEHAVLLDEGVVGAPLAVDERVLDEQVPGRSRIDAAVLDPTARDDGKSVERHPLVRDRRAALVVPPRLATCVLREV